jgi:hypothetical protein
LSTSKELTAAGAVIEGDFPRGQRLGQLGQSTAKLYTANVQGNIHYTVPRKFRLTLLDGGSFLRCHSLFQKKRFRLVKVCYCYDVPHARTSGQVA